MPKRLRTAGLQCLALTIDSLKRHHWNSRKSVYEAMKAFWAYKRVLPSSTILLTPPTVYPNTSQATCRANRIFPYEGLSTSYQVELLTYYTVAPIPSLEKSPRAQGCNVYTDSEFPCPLSSLFLPCHFPLCAKSFLPLGSGCVTAHIRSDALVFLTFLLCSIKQ